LVPEKLQGFYQTLLYHCCTISTTGALQAKKVDAQTARAKHKCAWEARVFVVAAASAFTTGKGARPVKARRDINLIDVTVKNWAAEMKRLKGTGKQQGFI